LRKKEGRLHRHIFLTAGFSPSLFRALSSSVFRALRSASHRRRHLLPSRQTVPAQHQSAPAFASSHAARDKHLHQERGEGPGMDNDGRRRGRRGNGESSCTLAGMWLQFVSPCQAGQGWCDQPLDLNECGRARFGVRLQLLRGRSRTRFGVRLQLMRGRSRARCRTRFGMRLPLLCCAMITAPARRFDADSKPEGQPPASSV